LLAVGYFAFPYLQSMIGGAAGTVGDLGGNIAGSAAITPA
jgi:hypothetical protein